MSVLNQLALVTYRNKKERQSILLYCVMYNQLLNIKFVDLSASADNG